MIKLKIHAAAVAVVAAVAVTESDNVAKRLGPPSCPHPPPPFCEAVAPTHPAPPLVNPPPVVN